MGADQAPGSWHLAQINVARLKAPLTCPSMRELASAIEQMNRLAEGSPGFIWRCDLGHEPRADPGAAAAGTVDDRLAFINVSAWQSYEHLHTYVYRSAHGRLVRQRSRWFTPISGPSTALWWISAGQTPTLDQALSRLKYLRTYGPSPQSFTLRHRYDPAGSPTAGPKHRTRQ